MAVRLWCPTHCFWLWETERAVESTAPKASSRSRTGKAMDETSEIFPRVSGKTPNAGIIIIVIIFSHHSARHQHAQLQLIIRTYSGLLVGIIKARERMTSQETPTRQGRARDPSLVRQKQSHLNQGKRR